MCILGTAMMILTMDLRRTMMIIILILTSHSSHMYPFIINKIPRRDVPLALDVGLKSQNNDLSISKHI